MFVKLHLICSNVIFTLTKVAKHFLQAPVVKKYPAKLSLTSFTCFFGLIQFLIIAAFIETDLERWKIISAEELFTILYAVILHLSNMHTHILIYMTQLVCAKSMQFGSQLNSFLYDHSRELYLPALSFLSKHGVFKRVALCVLLSFSPCKLF